MVGWKWGGVTQIERKTQPTVTNSNIGLPLNAWQFAGSDVTISLEADKDE